MKRFLAGGQMGEISLGATGLTRFLEDCQILREIEFSQKRYVDLMMILKYQLYAAYVYWIESAEELGLITEHIRDQIHAVNALWRVCFSTLQISLTSGNILYFHRLLSFLPRLAQQLISLFASLLT